MQAVLHRAAGDGLGIFSLRFLRKKSTPHRLTSAAPERTNIAGTLLMCSWPTVRSALRRCVDCGHDSLVTFSCKRRGLQSVVRRAAQAAAHLVDHVIPMCRRASGCWR